MAGSRMGRTYSLALALTLLAQVTHVARGLPTRGGYHPHHRTERAADMPTEEADWWQVGQEELQDTISHGFQSGVAKNVILFIGDGMGPSTVSAARIYQAQSRGVTYKDSLMAWERFPNTAISRTYNTDQHVADSAGTATAFLTGMKTRAGVVGLGQGAIRGDCRSSSGQQLKSILQHAHEKDKWTGVVTNTRITHATPSASYASVCDRDWEADADIPDSERGLGCTDIAAQLVDSTPGRNMRVLLGGGRRSFYPAGMPDPEEDDKIGRRLDNRTLVEEWISDKVDRGFTNENVRYVMNISDFENADPSKVEFLLGLFGNSHMKYETDRTDPLLEKWGEPSLAEMTEKAIKILSRNRNGYFLLVEGGRIDHGHHDNQAMRALNETVAMSDAVKKAMALTQAEDTLVVVSADHSHVFTLNGYANIGTNILGLENNFMYSSSDELPYANLAYTNGPGWDYHRRGRVTRRNLTQDAESGLLGSPTYMYDASLGVPYETHGGEDVAIYATGPMAHLFKGVRQQNFIAHAIMYASCVGPNQDLCNNGPELPGCLENGVVFSRINGALMSCLLTSVAVLWQ